MTYIKIFCLSIMFFIISYMVSFVDYVIRLATSDSIYYTIFLFLILTIALIYFLKISVLKFIEFKITSPKLLFSALIVFIGLYRFYNEFYFYIIEHPFILILFVLSVIFIAYIFITIIVKADKGERRFFIGYFIFVITLNIIIQFLNYDYNFTFIEWTMLALKSMLLLMTYYFTSKFLVTSKSYELMLSCYATIFLVLASQALFAIILNIS